MSTLNKQETKKYITCRTDEGTAAGILSTIREGGRINNTDIEIKQCQIACWHDQRVSRIDEEKWKRTRALESTCAISALFAIVGVLIGWKFVGGTLRAFSDVSLVSWFIGGALFGAILGWIIGRSIRRFSRSECEHSVGVGNCYIRIEYTNSAEEQFILQAIKSAGEKILHEENRSESDFHILDMSERHS